MTEQLKEIEEVKHNYKVDDNRHTSICSADIEWLAKHFFELGLQSQNNGEIVAEEESTCNKILNRIVGKNWNLICLVSKMNVNNGEKVKIRIIKGE